MADLTELSSHGAPNSGIDVIDSDNAGEEFAEFRSASHPREQTGETRGPSLTAMLSCCFSTRRDIRVLRRNGAGRFCYT